jgi:hypothetical protein
LKLEFASNLKEMSSAWEVETLKANANKSSTGVETMEMTNSLAVENILPL